LVLEVNCYTHAPRHVFPSTPAWPRGTQTHSAPAVPAAAYSMLVWTSIMVATTRQSGLSYAACRRALPCRRARSAWQRGASLTGNPWFTCPSLWTGSDSSDVITALTRGTRDFLAQTPVHHFAACVCVFVPLCGRHCWLTPARRSDTAVTYLPRMPG